MARPPPASGSYPYTYHRAEADDHHDDQEHFDTRGRHTRTASTARLTSPSSEPIRMERLEGRNASSRSISPPDDYINPASSTTYLYSSTELPELQHARPLRKPAPTLTTSGSQDPDVSGSRPSQLPGTWTSQPEDNSGPYSTPDLDSLLESPYRASEAEYAAELKEKYRQRAYTEGLGKDSSSKHVDDGTGIYTGGRLGTDASPEIKGKEKRRSFTASMGEQVFKSPIIGAPKKAKAVKLDPRQIIDQRSELTAEWGIYWYLPVLALSAFIAGVVGAAGHHAFYKSLHGQQSKNQLMMVRVGTAFAFFVKACLVGAVILAYRQRIWYTMRRKAFTIRAIDAMFGVIEDPTFFFTCPEMLKNAKIASLLAIASWLIPIASVLSPSALTSEVSLKTEYTHCMVPSLNFSAENEYDYRTSKRFFGNSLAFYNHTNPNNTKSDLAYDMPSYTNLRYTSQSIFNHGIVAPSMSPCPASYNCSFQLQLDGPGYKCESESEISPEIMKLIPFAKSTLVPDGDHVYLSNVTRGDFQKPDLPPTDKNLDPSWIRGTFHYEPELWIGYAINTTEKLGADNPWKIDINGTKVNRWTYRLEPRVFRCTYYHVKYHLQIKWQSGKQDVKVEKIDYIRPVVETVYGLPPDRTKFMRPGMPNYKLTAAYHAIAQLMRKYLQGSIKQSNDRAGMDGSLPQTSAELSMTNLVDQETAFPIEDLQRGVQKFLQSIIFSLWISPTMVISKEERVPCKAERYENRFKYYEQNLWIGYSIVVVTTLVAVIIGALALRSNGISSDTLFSRIMVTTRNPTLDHLSHGACLGGDPFPRELEHTKLRFGVLKEEGISRVSMGLGVSEGWKRPQHCAFGTIHETTEIVKGGLYAGLRNIKGRRDQCRGCDECANGGWRRKDTSQGKDMGEDEDGEGGIDCNEKTYLMEGYKEEESDEEVFYDWVERDASPRTKEGYY